MRIGHLFSGGVIVNYYCSSSCRHCLYNCSPHHPKNYIDRKFADIIFSRLSALGCHSVHIGGGEPFLNSCRLLETVNVARLYGVGIDYIETNSSWYTNEKTVCLLLEKLIDSGVTTLLISISPFHNEFIPFAKVQKLIKACNKTGMNVFPWISSFISDINKFDISVTHSPDEYSKAYGASYWKNAINRYSVIMRSRSLDLFRDVFPHRKTEEILRSSQPCFGLTDTSHFHIDLYGNYVPGLCAGLAVDISDIDKEVSAEKYPVLNLLYKRGVAGLYEYASENFGFKAGDSYISECDLCCSLRAYLAASNASLFRELRPVEFYNH